MPGKRIPFSFPFPFPYYHYHLYHSSRVSSSTCPYLDNIINDNNFH